MTAKGTPVEVDPAIARIIERAGAPVAVPPNVAPPDTLPGTQSVIDGLRALFDSLRHGIVAYTDQRERYGDIYQGLFVTTPFIVVWDADEIHKILKNEDRVWSGAMGWDALMFKGLDPRSGNLGTLLSLDFDEHRIGRKLVQPAFTLKSIEGYLAIARRRFDQTIPRWVERGCIDFKPEVRTLLATVAGEIFTGLHDSAQVGVVDRALSDFWNGGVALSRRGWLSPTFRRSRTGLQTLLKTFLALVPERRARGGDDLFSQMCSVTDPDGPGDEAMVRVFVTIMFGAFDTTSAAVTGMAYLLAKHPEWQERLREEARKIPAGELDVTSMKSLRQLEWVWKETLRLLPVASSVPRRALRDVVVGGHQLKAGALVGTMIGGIGRHPKWWTAPSKFDPERFSPERAEDKQHPAIYLPFGAGAHACVGMQLANMEIKQLWHTLLRSCRFTLEKDYEARHTFTPLGCISGKVRLRLEPLAS